MTIPELEKLAEQERGEFVKLWHLAPHEFSSQQKIRFDYLSSKIDTQRYWFEIQREEASKPRELLCTVKSREPFVIETVYGELRIPEILVPQQIRNLPGKEYHDDTLFAEVAVNLDNNTITHFRFKEYLKKMSPEEAKRFGDNLPTTTRRQL